MVSKQAAIAGTPTQQPASERWRTALDGPGRPWTALDGPGRPWTALNCQSPSDYESHQLPDGRTTSASSMDETRPIRGALKFR